MPQVALASGCSRWPRPSAACARASRASEFDHPDVPATMRTIVEGISSGRFADEWDAERDTGYPEYERLKEAAVGPEIAEFERQLRQQLGEGAVS